MSAHSMLHSAVAVLLVASGCHGSITGGAADGDDDEGNDEGNDEPDAAATDGDAPEVSCSGASGSRLRRIIRDHSDGSSALAGLHDSELDVACSFMKAIDGSLRCLPIRDRAPVASGRLYFTDSSCEQPVALITGSPAVDAPRLIAIANVNGCLWSDRFYQAGAEHPIAAGAAIRYRAPDGTCTATTAISGRYLDVVAEIEPDRFVAGAPVWRDHGRVDVMELEGDDGSTWCESEAGFRDAEHGDRACSPRRAEDGEIRCLPAATQRREVYTGRQCGAGSATTIAAMSSCEQADIEYAFAPLFCGRNQVLPLAGAVPPGSIYDDVSGTCEAWHPDGYVLRQLGPPALTSSFAALRRDFVKPGQRLERGDLVSDDGLRVFRTLWRDSASGSECFFVLHSDGVIRCIPTPFTDEGAAVRVVRYTDAACTDPIALAADDARCVTQAPAFAVEYPVGARTRYHRVGAPHAGPLYTDSEGSCAPAPSSSAYWELGAEVPLTEFVTGVERIE